MVTPEQVNRDNHTMTVQVLTYIEIYKTGLRHDVMVLTIIVTDKNSSCLWFQGHTCVNGTKDHIETLNSFKGRILYNKDTGTDYTGVCIKQQLHIHITVVRWF